MHLAPGNSLLTSTVRPSAVARLMPTDEGGVVFDLARDTSRKEPTPKPVRTPYEKPTLSKEGQLTRVINATDFVTIAGGRE